MATNNSINLKATGVVSYDASTGLFSSSTLTQYATVLAGANNSLTDLGVASNGQLVIGSTGAQPVLGSLTSTGSSVSITPGPGTINLEVAGAFADSFATDSGTATPALGVITFAGNAANSGGSVSFSGATSIVSLNLTDANNNLFLGIGAGNLLGSTYNTAVGFNAGNALDTGATANSIFGYNAGAQLVTGDNNSLLGTGAGYNLMTACDSNVMIGNTGTDGDSNKIIIGSQGSGAGQQNFCQIAGIVGVTASNPTVVTINSSTGQLGELAQLTVPLGGTGDSSFTAYAPLVGGTTTTGALQSASTGLSSSGFVLTSNGSSAVPSFQAPAYGAFPWSVVVAATQTMAINHGYVAADVTVPVVFTLPAVAAVGSIVRVAGLASGNGWSVAQLALQYVQMGSSASTVGVGGSISSTDNNDCVELLCVEANLGFVVLSSMGNINIV